MPTEALTCPNCSAPLHVEPNQTLALCIYCNSTVRFNYPAGSVGNAAAAPPRAVVEHTLSPEETAQIRELLLAGRRPEAVQRYQDATHADGQEAEQAIRFMLDQISIKVAQNQPLKARGWFMWFGSLVLALGSVAAIVAGANLLRSALLGHPMTPSRQMAYLVGGTIPFALGVVGLAGGSLLVWAGTRHLRATVKYWSAKTATARVLKLTSIGHTSLQYYAYRAWLEVRPAEGQAFRTQMTFEAERKDLSRLHEETVLEVQYLPGDPGSVIYRKVLTG